MAASSARIVGDFGGGWPPLVPLNPQVYKLPLTKIAKISQKYIADPLRFSHKLSTGSFPTDGSSLEGCEGLFLSTVTVYMDGSW